MLVWQLGELDERWTETVERVGARRQAVDELLSRWIHFDESYRKLLAALSALQTKLDDTNTLTAQDAIVNIETVSN